MSVLKLWLIYLVFQLSFHVVYDSCGRQPCDKWGTQTVKLLIHACFSTTPF